MFNSEQYLYLTETEIKPNRNAIHVLYFLIFGMTFCWVMNELGFFRVGTLEMRIGTFVPLFLSVALIGLLHAKPILLEKPATKWYIFSIVTFLTLCINTLLTFHTTMMLLLPAFTAMMYRSKKLGIAYLGASIFCTVVSPILGYVFHFWDQPFLEELLLIRTNVFPLTPGASDTITWLNIGKIILYLVLPRMLMVVSCGLLMFHVINLGVDHVNNQMMLEKLNRHDSLTGLYNRNFLKNVLHSTKGKIGVIFFDVNGLKVANDTLGHEYGDLLLKRSAASILAVCDDKSACAFRFGGDEFLILTEDADENALLRKIEEWKLALEWVNNENKTNYAGLVCSLAYGYAFGDVSEIESLIRKADTEMYQNKAKMKEKQY